MSEKLERIERYLSGQMEEQELRLFEQEMQLHSALQDQVQRMRILHAALEIPVETDLRQQLQQLREQEDQASAVSRSLPLHRRLLFRMAAAACALLVISTGLWWMLGSGKTDLNLYAEHHYLSYDPGILRGHDDGSSPIPWEWILDPTQWDSARAWLTAWIDTNPEDHEARFILADLLKKEGRIEEAKSQYLRVVYARSIRWGQKAEWNYLMLSLPSLNDSVSVRLLTEMKMQSTHSYHQQAVDLEKQLKK